MPETPGQIHTRRWSDPAEPGDGTRILICRYRPRGVAKKDETWDAWMTDLAPSVELHAAVYGKVGREPISWPLYRAAYLREMRKSESRARIADLACRVASGESITLLCSSSCERESRCHRSLLRDLIDAEMRKQAG